MIEKLLGACVDLPEQTVLVGGKPMVIDIRWNFGLPEEEPKACLSGISCHHSVMLLTSFHERWSDIPIIATGSRLAA